MASSAGKAPSPRLDQPEPHAVAIDEQGIVQVAMRGVWDVADVEPYLQAVARAIGKARAGFGRARLLVDIRALTPHSAAVRERFAARTPALFDTTNSWAFLVTSSLQKVQLRLTGADGNVQAFLSEKAATLWLASR